MYKHISCNFFRQICPAFLFLKDIINLIPAKLTWEVQPRNLIPEKFTWKVRPQNLILAKLTWKVQPRNLIPAKHRNFAVFWNREI